jgi:nicotinamidase-related amidase
MGLIRRDDSALLVIDAQEGFYGEERADVDRPVFVKPVFAAGDNPPIRAALDATGRHTVVAVGLETDVCVAHSAISLMERGYHVAAVTDAVFSPGAAHLHGLDRLRAEGVQLLSAKELFYDWTRTLADVRALVRAYPELETPPGFSL